MTPHLTLYTRAECPLCEQAYDLLSELGDEFDWEWSEQVIDDDTTLLARFGEMVPVIDIENGPALFGIITAEDLLAALAARSS